MAFLGPKMCDTCMQPFKPGDLIYQADGEPDWCFHAANCPGPPSEEDMKRIITELAYKAEESLLRKLFVDIYGTKEEIEAEQRAKTDEGAV